MKTSTTEQEVLFAPLWAPTGPSIEPVGSNLHVMEWDPALPGLGRVNQQLPVAIGDPTSTTHDFRGYGACGIAVADLTGDSQPEIVVTTFNGELVVFSQNQGVVNTAGIDYKMVPSALGAHNSILVGDFVAPTGKKELYLASSSGIRRFDVN